MLEFSVLLEPPPGLFETPAARLVEKLSGPSVVVVKGDVEPALFISVLLHGNETSGWDAMCQFMNSQRAQQAPRRTLILFIGNIEAAAEGVRSLPGQVDYNRIWRGSPNTEEGRVAEELLAWLAGIPLFAALDVHNNTGRNPHYSVLTSITPHTLGLANLFSDKAVYVEEPDTVLSRALERFCPSTAVEVGPVRDVQSDARALALIESYAELRLLPTLQADEINLYRAVARVHVQEGVLFDFVDEVDEAQQLVDDLVLTGGLEAVNFHALPAGTPVGMTHMPLGRVLSVLDPQHRDVTQRFLSEENGLITFSRSVTPAMFTIDHDVIRQDCLCYLMERMKG